MPSTYAHQTELAVRC